jgi:ABC-type microcin C transport system permease subunit YejE
MSDPISASLLIISVGLLGFIMCVYSQFEKEKGFIFSTKKMGAITKYIFLVLILGSLYNIHEEKNEILRIAYDNNVTLPEKYNVSYKSFKMEDYEKTIEYK